MNTEPYRIDVHHHILPEYYLESLADHGIDDAAGAAFSAWSPEGQLAGMDRHGIATAVNSIAPGISHLAGGEARRFARRLNETLAELVARNPARFGAFATLPMPDVDGTLAEIEYAYDVMGADGVSMLTSVEGRYPGDPIFEPVMAELDRRRAVVHVHPNTPESSKVLKLALPISLVEFVFDTTRMVANLIYSGTMERYPNISFILPHAGGTVPFLAWRLGLGKVIPELAAKAPQGATAYLKRFYYDTALASSPGALASLRQLVDPSRILYGSDTPYLPAPMIPPAQHEFAASPYFDDAGRAAVERGNGLALFPRLRSVAASTVNA